MPVRLPEPVWPPELVEEGPPEDPSILLSGAVTIGSAPYRIVAVRINPRTLAADFRTDLEEDVYAECQVEEILEELTFVEDIDQTVLVPLPDDSYVMWMMPFAETGQD